MMTTLRSYLDSVDRQEGMRDVYSSLAGLLEPRGGAMRLEFRFPDGAFAYQAVMQNRRIRIMPESPGNGEFYLWADGSIAGKAGEAQEALARATAHPGLGGGLEQWNIHQYGRMRIFFTTNESIRDKKEYTSIRQDANKPCKYRKA